MALIIGISGIRGIAGEDLTPQIAVDFAQAFGTYLRQGRGRSPYRPDSSGKTRLVLGRDTRPTGEFLKHAVISGLLVSGCEVINLEICPTPTVQLMVGELNADGGIVLTASHNPQEYNGLKFISSEGIFLNAGQVKNFLDIYKKRKYNIDWDKLGSLKRCYVGLETHLKKVLELLTVELIQKRKFKVAVDCCNGAGSLIVPLFLKKLDCRVREINTQPTGKFPHSPEPIPENLAALCSEVKNSHADVGFALDADADRLAIVSEKGNPLGEELTLALAVRFFLSRHPGTVVTNLSTTSLVDDVAAEFNCLVIRTPVGEINVVEGAKQQQAVIAGEGNGGVILPALHYGRDGLVGIGLILEYLATAQKSISTLVGELPRYFMAKKKYPGGGRFISEVGSRLRDKYKDRKIDFTDGMKIVDKNWWIHIRPSRTEPVMRVIAEAKTQQLLDKILGEVEFLVKNGAANLAD